MERTFKIVTVKHPNNIGTFTFRVPPNLDLGVGDFVLCKTSKSEVPQVGKCITPSFMILECQLKEYYNILPHNLAPIVGILQPKMYAFESERDDV